MVVARAVNTDLLLNWTPSATTVPTLTQITTLLTNIYTKAYREVWGPGTYQAYDALDEDEVIDTEECKELLISIASQWVQQWHESGIPSGGGAIVAMPILRFSPYDKTELKGMLKRRSARIGNVRLWGEETDDY